MNPGFFVIAVMAAGLVALIYDPGYPDRRLKPLIKTWAILMLGVLVIAGMTVVFPWL
jgi:hypothetical protein